MNRSLKMPAAPISKRLISFLLDIAVTIVTVVALYFITIHAFLMPFSSYGDSKKYTNDFEAKYSLNLDSHHKFRDYEKVLKQYYFVDFKDEIVKLHDNKHSIEYIYNTTVLDLPEEPTLDKHSNDFFTYLQDGTSGGVYDVNQVGILIPGLALESEYYVKNLASHFQYKYSQLTDISRLINSQYKESVDNVLLGNALTRIGASIVSVAIFYILIPFINKNGQTIFEKVYGVSHVNFKNGYKLPWWKILLRPVAYFLIPILILSLAAEPKFIALIIFPLFISVLLLIFQKDNKDLADLILSMYAVNDEEALIFKNANEEKMYESSEEYKNVDDKDFLTRLENMDEFNLSVSREEELHKNNKK